MIRQLTFPPINGQQTLTLPRQPTDYAILGIFFSFTQNSAAGPVTYTMQWGFGGVIACAKASTVPLVENAGAVHEITFAIDSENAQQVTMIGAPTTFNVVRIPRLRVTETMSVELVPTNGDPADVTSNIGVLIDDGPDPRQG